MTDEQGQRPVNDFAAAVDRLRRQGVPAAIVHPRAYNDLAEFVRDTEGRPHRIEPGQDRLRDELRRLRDEYRAMAGLDVFHEGDDVGRTRHMLQREMRRLDRMRETLERIDDAVRLLDRPAADPTVWWDREGMHIQNGRLELADHQREWARQIWRDFMPPPRPAPEPAKTLRSAWRDEASGR